MAGGCFDHRPLHERTGNLASDLRRHMGDEEYMKELSGKQLE
jgi:hypothetical protein